MRVHLYASIRRPSYAQRTKSFLNLGDSSAHLHVVRLGGGERTWEREGAEVAARAGYGRQVDEEDASWWAPCNSIVKLVWTDGSVKVYRALRRNRAG